MPWQYQQTTGQLSHDGTLIAIGYSGAGAGKNNPLMETVVKTGPIPRGVYAIGPPHDTPTHGPHVMRLTPADGHDMHGRDGFLIHGDNLTHTASEGCIILPRDIRDRISSSPDHALEVTL